MFKWKCAKPNGWPQHSLQWFCSEYVCISKIIFNLDVVFYFAYTLNANKKVVWICKPQISFELQSKSYLLLPHKSSQNAKLHLKCRWISESFEIFMWLSLSGKTKPGLLPQFEFMNEIVGLHWMWRVLSVAKFYG